MKDIKITLLQITPKPHSLRENWDKIKNLILNAIKRDDLGDLVILPELSLCGIPEDQEKFCHTISEITSLLNDILDFTSKHNLTVITSLPNPCKTKYVLNTTYLFQNGRKVEVYSKINLFRPLNEHLYFEPGNELKVHDVAIKDHVVTMGFLTCFDLRFPELARYLTDQGAEIIIYTALWPVQRINHFTGLLKARAIENQIFTIGCNAYGQSGKNFFGGNSMVISPDGKILLRIDHGENYSTIPIDLDDILLTRQRFYTATNILTSNVNTRKLYDLDELVAITAKRKRLGQRMVFTNGCFDILHAGHVRYLKHARSLGDFLVLGLNSDESIKRIKGESRPVNPQELRIKVLEGIQYVDYITIFNENTPINLINSLRPNVLVKGEDWPEEEIVGADLVKSYGGKVVRVPFEFDISTTKIINRIKTLP